MWGEAMGQNKIEIRKREDERVLIDRHKGNGSGKII